MSGFRALLGMPWIFVEQMMLFMRKYNTIKGRSFVNIVIISLAASRISDWLSANLRSITASAIWVLL